MEKQDELQKLFDTYCKKDNALKCSYFVKIFKDAKLFDSHFKSTSADIIFSKIKTKGAQKVTYEQFLKGLELAAVEKKVSLEEICEGLSKLHGPDF